MARAARERSEQERATRLVVDCVRLDAGSVDHIEVNDQCILDEPGIQGALVVDGVVHLEVVVRAAGGSLVADGRVVGVWAAECRRCLEDVRGPLEASLHEVFEWEATEGETWPISDHRIDLAPAAREAAVLALPLAPLCSEDCAGPVPDRFPTGPAAVDYTAGGGV
ncbi:MAG: DUF177 domain-containing protein [Acidimicrobiaceae bacterium]|nr:DUF177 domain-containing protein [Acidimicrobiaceae bacterium]MYE08872.1 DUF177 domain-containing protein [Acidimicrobiaceae bacterium]MYI36738.1 DUF177 domain-containing protein [Acidimicrobiaceae bacterium]